MPLLSDWRGLPFQDREIVRRCKLVDIGRCMGEAAAGAECHVRAVCRFNRKRQETTGPCGIDNGREDRFQSSKVNENIGSKDKVIWSGELRGVTQHLHHVAPGAG